MSEDNKELDAIGIKEDRKVIRCRKIRPVALIPLSACLKCEYHGHITLTSPGNEQNGLPPVEDVACNLPSLVRVEYFLDDRG